MGKPMFCFMSVSASEQWTSTSVAADSEDQREGGNPDGEEEGEGSERESHCGGVPDVVPSRAAGRSDHPGNRTAGYPPSGPLDHARPTSPAGTPRARRTSELMRWLGRQVRRVALTAPSYGGSSVDEHT